MFVYANVAVGGDNITGDGPQGITQTFELVIAMNGTDDEITDAVDKAKKSLQFPPADSRVAAVIEGCNRAETEIAGDGTEEREALDKEKINTQGNIAMT